jgi:hypothetical protein
MKKKLLILILLLVLIATYVGVYIGLSANGQYIPTVFGLNGVKWYDWAPRGFVKDGQWNGRVMVVFLPLWKLDRRSWHTPQTEPNDKYPFRE